MKIVVLLLISTLSFVFASPLSKGKKAPAFSLIDEMGMNHSLSSAYENYPVILLFYPADESPRCTQQLCEIRDNYEEMLQFDSARVYGLNSSNLESHRAFKEKHNYPFPLLEDKGWKVAEKYGVAGSLFGVRRWVFIIDKNGVIQLSKKGKPSIDTILEALKGLK